MKISLHLAMFAAAVATLVAPQAAAQSSSKEWTFNIAPYLWAAGMDGTMTIANTKEDVDVPFSTIIDNLDMALMGHFDMRNDRWVIASDLVFVDLGNDQDVTNGDHTLGTVTVGIDMTLFEVVGGYRVSPAVALLAGTRWVDMGGSFSYAGQVVGDDADASTSWIDPLVGVNVFAPLSEKWWLGVRADVGGFGVGSELTWQAYADIGFKISRVISLVLGYHALDIDYEDGAGLHYFGMDMMVSGPQLGVVFTF